MNTTVDKLHPQSVLQEDILWQCAASFSEISPFHNRQEYGVAHDTHCVHSYIILKIFQTHVDRKKISVFI